MTFLSRYASLHLFHCKGLHLADDEGPKLSYALFLELNTEIKGVSQDVCRKVQKLSDNHGRRS